MTGQAGPRMTSAATACHTLAKIGETASRVHGLAESPGRPHGTGGDSGMREVALG